ncbi:hypothetical protein [Geminocystis herdmanii]|uniref:hypothetical protein n=1 Tax=Geminocystis herdmanii TaxID=669359 RepID=UPI000349DC3D|nr:hypothetical protein [Geminocystis herdmanii]
MNPEITLTWNILEEAFEIVNISSITVNPQDAIATYKSADDPNQEGDNEISDELWADYTPPLPYIKNTTRNLQFNESQFIASPGQEIGITTYVTTSDGYTWAAMSTAINAMWPYNSADYSGVSSQNAYYAGNLVTTPPGGVVKVTANYKGQNMKFWANEDGLTSDNPNAVKLDRYFVIDEWGNEYIMHASGQLDQSQVATAFEEAVLPEGWTKETRQLSEDLILNPAEGGDGSFHYLVFRDSADNSYHQTKWSNTGSLSAQIEDFPIWGGQDDNILFGDANGEIRNDLIYGAGGDDTIIPGLGNDEIWGDAGIDTVILTGDSADYSIEEIATDDISTFTVSGFGYTKTLYDVEYLQFDNETISLNKDSLLNTQIYRFRTGEGTYLYVGDEERQSILVSNYNFVEEGEVFKVSMTMDDDLIPIYRFRNTNLTGAYLYVGEEERQSILQSDYGFVEEGLAFYTYGAMSDQGQDIYRFQTSPGAYIFVAEEERQSILENYSTFTEEGVAFNVT